MIQPRSTIKFDYGYYKNAYANLTNTGVAQKNNNTMFHSNINSYRLLNNKEQSWVNPSIDISFSLIDMTESGILNTKAKFNTIKKNDYIYFGWIPQGSDGGSIEDANWTCLSKFQVYDIDKNNSDNISLKDINGNVILTWGGSTYTLHFNGANLKNVVEKYKLEFPEDGKDFAFSNTQELSSSNRLIDVGDRDASTDSLTYGTHWYFRLGDNSISTSRDITKTGNLNIPGTSIMKLQSVSTQGLSYNGNLDTNKLIVFDDVIEGDYYLTLQIGNYLNEYQPTNIIKLIGVQGENTGGNFVYNDKLIIKPKILGWPFHNIEVDDQGYILWKQSEESHTFSDKMTANWTVMGKYDDAWLQILSNRSRRDQGVHYDFNTDENGVAVYTSKWFNINTPIFADNGRRILIAGINTGSTAGSLSNIQPWEQGPLNAIGDIPELSGDDRRFRFLDDRDQNEIVYVKFGLYVYSNKLGGARWMGESSPITTKANSYEGLIYYYNSSAVDVGDGKIALSGVKVIITALIPSWRPTYNNDDIINNVDTELHKKAMYKTDDVNNKLIYEYTTNDSGKIYFRSEESNFEIKISKAEFIENKAEKTIYIFGLTSSQTDGSTDNIKFDISLNPTFNTWDKETNEPKGMITNIGNTIEFNAPGRALDSIGFEFLPRLYKKNVSNEWERAQVKIYDNDNQVQSSINSEIVGYDIYNNLVLSSEIVNARIYRFEAVENGEYKIDGIYIDTKAGRSFKISAIGIPDDSTNENYTIYREIREKNTSFEKAWEGWSGRISFNETIYNGDYLTTSYYIPRALISCKDNITKQKLYVESDDDGKFFMRTSYGINTVDISKNEWYDKTMIKTFLDLNITSKNNSVGRPQEFDFHPTNELNLSLKYTKFTAGMNSETNTFKKMLNDGSPYLNGTNYTSIIPINNYSITIRDSYSTSFEKIADGTEIVFEDVKSGYFDVIFKKDNFLMGQNIQNKKLNITRYNTDLNLFHNDVSSVFIPTNGMVEHEVVITPSVKKWKYPAALNILDEIRDTLTWNTETDAERTQLDISAVIYKVNKLSEDEVVDGSVTHTNIGETETHYKWILENKIQENQRVGGLMEIHDIPDGYYKVNAYYWTRTYGILDLGWSHFQQVLCNCDVKGRVYTISDAVGTKQYLKNYSIQFDSTNTLFDPKDVVEIGTSGSDEWVVQARPDTYSIEIIKDNFLHTEKIKRYIRDIREDDSGADDNSYAGIFFEFELEPILPGWSSDTDTFIGPRDMNSPDQSNYNYIKWNFLESSEFSSNGGATTMTIDKINYYLSYANPIIRTKYHEGSTEVARNVDISYNDNAIEISFYLNYNFPKNNFLDIYIPGFKGTPYITKDLSNAELSKITSWPAEGTVGAPVYYFIGAEISWNNTIELQDYNKHYDNKSATDHYFRVYTKLEMASLDSTNNQPQQYKIFIPKNNNIIYPSIEIDEKDGIKYLTDKKVIHQTSTNPHDISFSRLSNDNYVVQAIYKTLTEKLKMYSGLSSVYEVNFAKLIKIKMVAKGFNANAQKHVDRYIDVPMPGLKVILYDMEFETDQEGVIYVRVPPGIYTVDIIKNAFPQAIIYDSSIDINKLKVEESQGGKDVIKLKDIPFFGAVRSKDYDKLYEIDLDLPNWADINKSLASAGSTISWLKITPPQTRTASNYTVDYKIYKSDDGKPGTFDTEIIIGSTPDTIDGKFGFTRLSDGWYKLRIIYTYTSVGGQKIILASPESNAVKIQQYQVTCDITKLYIPSKFQTRTNIGTATATLSQYDLFDVSYGNMTDITIKITKDQLDAMYAGFDSFCGITPGEFDPGIDQKWILTNIYIYVQKPEQLQPDIYSIFNSLGEGVGGGNNDITFIGANGPSKMDINTMKGWTNYKANKVTFDNRTDITDQNRIYVYNDNGERTLTKKSIDGNSPYNNRDEWPWSTSKLIECSLELTGLTKGIYKIAWGYDFYHESARTFLKDVDLDNQDFTNEKLSVGVKKPLTNGVLTADLNWDTSYNRFKLLTMPELYIPGEPTLVYDEDVEELIIDISNIVRGETVYNNIQNSLIEAQTDRTTPYYIMNFKMYLWKPGDWSGNWLNESLFHPNGNMKDDISGNIYKIYSSLNNEIEQEPKTIWSCHTRISENGKIQLKLKNPYDGFWNVIWGYDYFKNPISPETEDVFSNINTKYIKLINLDDIIVVNRKEVLPNKLKIEFIRNEGNLKVSLDKEMLEKLNNILDKKRYTLENVVIKYLSPPAIPNEYANDSAYKLIFKSKLLANDADTDIISANMDISYNDAGNIIDVFHEVPQRVGYWGFIWSYDVVKKNIPIGALVDEPAVSLESAKTIKKENVSDWFVGDNVAIKKINKRDSGLFDIYIPSKKPNLYFDKAKDVIKITIPDAEITQLKEMVKKLAGENFDEMGLSIDYIIYYWLDYEGIPHPLQPGVINYSEGVKNKMFSDNNRLTIKGVIYPNIYKLVDDGGENLTNGQMDSVIDKIFPKTNEYELDVSDLNFTKKFIATWTYKLKATGYMKGHHISAFSNFNMFTPQLEALNNDRNGYPLDNDSVSIISSIYEKIGFFKFFIPKAMTLSYFKSSNTLSINIDQGLVNFQKILDRTKLISIDNYRIFAWSNQSWGKLTDKNTINDVDINYIGSEGMFSSLYEVQNINITPPLEIENGKEIPKAATNISCIINNPQNGITRVCWTYDITYKDFDGKIQKYGIGKNNMETADYINLKNESVKEINTLRKIPTYFYNAEITKDSDSAAKLNYNYNCELNILTLTIPKSELTKLKNQLNESFFKSIADDTARVNYVLYEIKPPDGSDTKKTIFDRFDINRIDGSWEKMVIQRSNDGEDEGLYPNATGWSLSKNDIYKKGIYYYFWTYEISVKRETVEQGGSPSEYFNPNAIDSYEPILPNGPLIWNHSNEVKYSVFSGSDTYYNLFLNKKVDSEIISIENFCTPLKFTLNPPVYKNPSFLNLKYEPRIYNDEAKLIDTLIIKFPKSQFQQLSGHILNEFISSGDVLSGNLLDVDNDKNIYKMNRDIIIRVYIYNINDTVKLMETDDYIADLSDNENVVKFDVSLYDILISRDDYTRSVDISNNELINLRNTFITYLGGFGTEKMDSIRDHFISNNTILDKDADEGLGTKWDAYKQSIRDHETMGHSGWGCFYNYDINLELDIFNPGNNKYDIDIVKRPDLSTGPVNNTTGFVNYCPITIKPDIAIVSYKFKALRSFFKKSECFIGGKKVCNNSVPTYKSKISLGSFNNKKMKYASLMRMNRKNISSVIRQPNRNLVMDSGDDSMNNRNEIIILDDAYYEELKNYNKKDTMTQNENKFC